MDTLDPKSRNAASEYDPAGDGLYAINRWSPARLLTRDRLSTVISVTRPVQSWFSVDEWRTEVAAQIADKHAGDMCYLIDYEIDHRESHYGQTFRMTIAPSSYAEHLATRQLLLRHPETRQQIAELLQKDTRSYVQHACPSSIAISVIIISDDGRLLAVRRSSAVQDAKNLWTLGPCEAMILRPPIPGTNTGFQGEDLFDLAERCLREETGLEPEDYASQIVISWIGLKLEVARGHVVAQVKLTIPEDEVLERASRSHSIFESDRFEWIPFNLEEIRRFICDGTGSFARRDWITDTKLAFAEAWRMRTVWDAIGGLTLYRTGLQPIDDDGASSKQAFAPISTQGMNDALTAPEIPAPVRAGLPRPDLLVVTVNEHETKAVHDAFLHATGTEGVPVSLEGRLYHDLGAINGTTVYHAISEMGSGNPGAMQQTVDKAIRALDPGAVVAVGIAFGVNEKSQSVGDILLCKQIQLYDLQRAGAEIVLRGDKPHSTPRLINHFETFSQLKWRRAKVRPGMLLSGEKLIDDKDYRDQLIALQAGAVGGEMEGAGLYVASADHKVDWIVIKAICDWADGNKKANKKQRQKRAAKNAAEFLVESLRYSSLKRLDSPPRVRK